MGSNLQMLLGRVRGRGEHVRAVFSNLKLSGKKVQIDRHEPKTPRLLFLREKSELSPNRASALLHVSDFIGYLMHYHIEILVMPKREGEGREKETDTSRHNHPMS